MNFEKLTAALDLIAKNPDWRNEFIRQLLNFERNISNQGVDIRELATGPIVDALFEENQIIRKNLLDGTLLDFYYRSKIARDFVMSEPEIPTHAWEPQTTKLLVNLATKAKQAVIGGAYFGDHAIVIAKQMVKNNGLIHAFEPNDDQRGMLEHNARLNNLDNIRARKEGLWDNSSTTLKLVGDDSFAHPEAVKEGADGGFQTITIEDYMSEVGAPRLDLIMLDIEGAELKVLQGAKRFLSMPADSSPNIVFEVHRHYVDWSDGLSNTDILKFLIKFGYKVYAVRDFNSNFDLSNKPIELIPADFVNLEGPPHGFNMVAVKDESIFKNPEYRFCKNVSPKLLRHKNPAMHHPIDGL